VNRYKLKFKIDIRNMRNISKNSTCTLVCNIIIRIYCNNNKRICNGMRPWWRDIVYDLQAAVTQWCQNTHASNTQPSSEGGNNHMSDSCVRYPLHSWSRVARVDILAALPWPYHLRRETRPSRKHSETLRISSLSLEILSWKVPKDAKRDHFLRF